MSLARQPGWIQRSLRFRAKRVLRRAWRATTGITRRLLVRYVAAPPLGRAAQVDRRVIILLFSAWGMGGTTRTTLNLAGYLAEHYEVEIVSVIRRREAPFFGEFPPGVKVTALHDYRPQAVPRGLAGVIARLLIRLPSVLVHPCERRASEFNLRSDVRLARKLRRQSGFLLGTRPGLNLIAAELSPPGMILVGQEHMHLRHHHRALRKAMKRLYPRLDVFTVLTEGAKRDYDKHLNGGVPLARIPNTVRDLGGRTADLDAKTVFAAGRLVGQKGFDLLIPAFGRVAAAHPDWRLKISGRGPARKQLLALIEDHGLGEVVTLAPPATDMGSELERASVFALSSRFEGFPLVLLEAMSKGTAVVSFDCPTGPADIVDDHRNGILVPPEDVDAFAAGLVEMVEDEELRRRCGAAAIDTARAYRMDSIGPLWGRLFTELIEARASSAPHDRAALPGVAALE